MSEQGLVITIGPCQHEWRLSRGSAADTAHCTKCQATTFDAAVVHSLGGLTRSSEELGGYEASPPTPGREAVAHLTDDQIAGAWDCWPKTSITSRAAAVSFVRHVLAAHPPAVEAAQMVREPFAWGHPDGRVVPSSTKRQGDIDGGATKSSLAGYTIPLYPPQRESFAATPPPVEGEREAPESVIDLAAELWAMAQGPQPMQDAVEAIAVRLSSAEPGAAPTTIDHRALLVKYMRHVVQEEGCDFLLAINGGQLSDVKFTEADVMELRRIAQEANQEGYPL